MKSVDLYAGRIAGSFDVASDDASGIDHDSEVALLVQGIVKELTLKDTRSGELQLSFVIKPTDVKRLLPWQLRVLEHPETIVAGTEPVDAGEADDELVDASPIDEEDDLDDFEDPDPFVAPATVEKPVGQRVSTVQPHSNVAGSSQVERDPVLARFLEVQ